MMIKRDEECQGHAKQVYPRTPREDGSNTPVKNPNVMKLMEWRPGNTNNVPSESAWDLFFILFFWSGLSDPIACSLLGGGITTQNSGYKVTRLCPY